MLSRARTRQGALHRSIAVSVAAVALGAGLTAPPALAQEPEQEEVRTCRGTAVRTGNLVVLADGLRIGSANNRETPCNTDRDPVASFKVPVKNTLLNPIGALLGVHTGTLLDVRAAEGLAADQPNNTGAGATARVAYVRLNVLRQVIEVHAVASHARARMDGGCEGTTQYGYSHIAALIVNGRVVFAGSDASTIPLGPLGGIHLNQTTRDGNTLTQRAVFIDLPGDSLDVALGESVAGTECAEPEPEPEPEPQGV